MQLMRSPVFVLALLSTIGIAASARPVPLVGPLKYQETSDGCSWSASSPDMGLVFLGEVDDSRSLMNIGGTDVELTLVAEQGKLGKVDDVLERTFRAGEVLVHARYRATWVCPEVSDNCEVTKFTVSFEVLKGSKKETVRATGDVGC